MHYYNGQYFELTLKQKLIYFIIALLLNSFGNGLSIAAQLGSGPWAAAAVNLAYVSKLPIMLFLALEVIIAALINLILVEKIHWEKFFGNIIFGLLFSLIASEVANWFSPLISSFPFFLKIIIDFFGIWIIGISISLIQRDNFVLHPLDNLTNVCRFKFFHGSAPLGQISNFIVAIAISLICLAISKKIFSIGIGTIYSFVFQGTNIVWGDHHLFKHLLHVDPTKI